MNIVESGKKKKEDENCLYQIRGNLGLRNPQRVNYILNNNKK